MFLMICGAYIAVLTSLPLLAQWRWGWRGSVIATVAALVFVAAANYYIYYYLVFNGLFEPAPAGANAEAKPEKNLGAGIMLLVPLLMPAAAVLAGAVLAAIWASIQFANGRGKVDTPGTPADALSPPQMASGAAWAKNVTRILLLIGLAASLLAATYLRGLEKALDALPYE
jgi:hypothetical protein